MGEVPPVGPATLDSGALPALEILFLVAEVPASAAAQAAVQEALERSVRARTRTDLSSRLRRITSTFPFAAVLDEDDVVGLLFVVVVVVVGLLFFLFVVVVVGLRCRP